MNFSWAGIFVFGVASVGILLLIAVYDMPVDEIVDRRTGELLAASKIEDTIPLLPDPAVALRLARNTGDARTAAALLRDLTNRVSDPSVLEPAIRTMDAELAMPTDDERRDALDALAAWDGTGLDTDGCLQLLEDLAADGTVAGPVEAFFAPAVDLATAKAEVDGWLEEGGPPDRIAAAMSRLSREEPAECTAARCAALAARYPIFERTRARIRWSLRALRRAPADAANATAISQTYLDLGRQRESLLVLTAASLAGAGDLDLERRRAAVSGWVSLPASEAAALEAVVAIEPDEVEARKRLIALYDLEGDIWSSLPHVVYLARRDGSPEVLGKGADFALACGETDLCVELLGEAAAADEDPRPWRERIVEVYLIDLRVEEALGVLKVLEADFPGPKYSRAVEGLLRRFHQNGELADRLMERVRRESNPAIEQEAIDLFTSLGRDDRVREIMVLKIRRIEDPAEFFANLWGWWNVGLPGLAEKASEMAKSPRLDEKTATQALLLLDGMREAPDLIAAAWEIIDRFPDLPAAIPFLVRAAQEERMANAGEGEEGGDEAGRAERELQRLIEMAKRSDLPVEDRIEVAEQLFYTDRMDLALALYESVLRDRPDERLALLRIGQVKAWGNDPHGAVPLFERCLELYGPGDGELPFLLGEAYWACGRTIEGRKMHEQALEILRADEFLGPIRESMVAKILARFGRGEESRAIFDRLLALQGDGIDLLLDYADALLVLDDLPAAEGLLERARAIDPDDVRVLRFEGYLMLQLDRLEAALDAFERGRRQHGPDAGFASGAGETLLAMGRLADAADAWEDALLLQPDNRNVAYSLRRLNDRLAWPVMEMETEFRTAGDDRILDARAEGTILLDRDATRAAAVLEAGRLSGVAFAGLPTAERYDADMVGLSLSASRVLDPAFEIAGGIDLFPLLSGRAVAGAWVEGRLRSRKPYATVDARLDVGEVLRSPAAAAGLGGVRDGLTLTGFSEVVPGSWWASGRLRGSYLSIDPAAGERTGDVQLEGELLLGYWISGTGPETQERVVPRSVGILQEGSTVAGEPPMERGPRIAAWVAWSGMRLLGDRNLTGLLPMAEGYDYLTATLRGTESLGDGLVAEAEAWAGFEVGSFTPTGGLQIGLTWRPRADLEVRFRGSRGLTLDRGSGEEDATSLSLAVTLAF